jgi:DNA-binding IclR family transcriptional regulator
VLLAFQDKGVRALRIEESLSRNPDHADPQLDHILDRIAANGYESAHSIQVRGLYAVSFPILDSQKHAIAALTVPYAERIDQSKRKSIAEVQSALEAAALLLSNRVSGIH